MKIDFKKFNKRSWWKMSFLLGRWKNQTFLVRVWFFGFDSWHVCSVHIWFSMSFYFLSSLEFSLFVISLFYWFFSSFNDLSLISNFSFFFLFALLLIILEIFTNVFRLTSLFSTIPSFLHSFNPQKFTEISD